MAIDTNAPLLIPAGVNGNIYGLTNGINVLNSTNSGLSINYSGGSIGGTLTFNTVGNLNSLAQYNEIGLVYYAGGNQFENASLTGSTGIRLVNVGTSYTFSVIANSTTQNFLTQHNSGDENLTAGNLNLIAGEGISIGYSVASNIANYTISSSQTGAISNATYVTLTNELASLPNSFDLGSLTTGLLKNTVLDGVSVLSMAIVDTDYQAANATLTQLSALELTNGSILFYNGVELTNLVPGTVGQYIAVDESGVPAYTSPATASDATFVLLQTDAGLPNSFGLGTLETGLLKQTVNAGLAAIENAVAGVDYQVGNTYLTQIAEIVPSAGSLISYSESLGAYKALTIGLPESVLAVDSGGTGLTFIPQVNIFDGLLAASNTWTGNNVWTNECTFTGQLNADNAIITNYLTTTVGATLGGITESTTINNSGVISTDFFTATGNITCGGGFIGGQPTVGMLFTQENFTATQSTSFALLQTIDGATVLNSVAGQPLGFAQGASQVGQVNVDGVWLLPEVQISTSITAPTQPTGTSNTTLATTQFVQEALTGSGSTVTQNLSFGFYPSSSAVTQYTVPAIFEAIGDQVFVTIDGQTNMLQTSEQALTFAGACYLQAQIPAAFVPTSMANAYKYIGLGSMKIFGGGSFLTNMTVNISIFKSGANYYFYITPQAITSQTLVEPYTYTSNQVLFSTGYTFTFGSFINNAPYIANVNSPNLSFSYSIIDV
jgi:hypothetical protein